MKRIVIAGAMALFASSGAFAADLPLPGPAPVPPASYYPGAQEYNWRGIYFGVNAGYGFGQSRWSDPGNPNAASTGNFTVNGPVFGGTAGINAQWGHVVFGAEFDADYSLIEGTVTPTNRFCSLAIGVGGGNATSCKTQNSLLSTARARFGYAFDRFLVFGTGGAAFGNIRSGVTGGAATSPTFQWSTETGWTAGGGIEYAITDNWTVKAEYLYIMLSNGQCNSGSCGINGFSPITATAIPTSDTVKFSTSLVRFGANYKFDWP
jgi:outer membrane immunogenic protein